MIIAIYKALISKYYYNNNNYIPHYEIMYKPISSCDNPYN